MVGLCGVIGGPDEDMEPLSQNLTWLGSEDVFNYIDENIKVCSVAHESIDEEQPAKSKDEDTYIWIWGEIYGHDNGTKYEPKSKSYPNLSTGEYCAKLYEEYGLDFIEGLNSNFAGVVYDKEEKWIVIFTDRLSARPIFYTKPSNGSFIFSTSIQALTKHRSFTPEFDLNGLYDFFKTGRVYGLKTVLKGVKQLHPGSILKYDLKTNEYQTHLYWQPKYRPKNINFDEFVDEFYSLFKRILSEQTSLDLDYGMMLSGGSDSRLIAGTVQEKLQCFHMNEIMDDEAKTAKLVAEECEHDFKFLKRKENYYDKVLKKTSQISNFLSWFEEGHSASFVEELRKDSECILMGQYADTLFGHYVPEKSLQIPLVGNLGIPVMERYDNIEEFDKVGKHSRNKDYPTFLDQEFHNRVNSRYESENQVIRFHGVKYESLNGFTLGPWYYYYPITNPYTFLMCYTLTQTLPVRYPYLDNRIIDLSLRMPTKYLLRKDISNRTLSKYNGKLANIPDPSTGLSLHKSKMLHWFSKTYQDFLERFSSTSQNNSGGWADYDNIIRETDLAEKRLERYSEILENCDFISKRKVQDIWKQQLAGKNNANQLLPLLTFLENPITERIILSCNE